MEKVIKGLECCANGNSCSEKCPYDELGDSFDDCVPQLARDALILLKEQEPRKPIYNEQKYGDHLPHCGNCEKALPNNGVYLKVNFCHYCGQAVKWDD